MGNFDSTNCLKWCTPLLVFMLKGVPGNAQLALAGKSISSGSLYSTQGTKPAAAPKKSLKEVVGDLKAQHQIQIAFREGLLDNKFVPTTLPTTSPAVSVESSLTQLLTAFDLGLKRIIVK